MNCSLLLGLVGLLTALLFWLMRHASELNRPKENSLCSFAHTGPFLFVYLCDCVRWVLLTVEKNAFLPYKPCKYIKCDEQCRTAFELLIYSFSTRAPNC